MTRSKSINLFRHSRRRRRIRNPKLSLPRYDHFTVRPGFFLTQGVDGSMISRILNGWGNPRNLVFSPAST